MKQMTAATMGGTGVPGGAIKIESVLTFVRVEEEAEDKGLVGLFSGCSTLSNWIVMEVDWEVR